MCKKTLILILTAMLLICGCGKAETKGTISVFAASSLNRALEEIIENYKEINPEVKIHTNYDSSGTLMTQIAEGGAECDIFFSASEKQIDALEEAGLTVSETEKDILKNKLCVVTYKGSNTKVTGLRDLNRASSLAIAGEGVPAGDYTRKALTNIGIDISKAFADMEINECVNVGAVVSAIAEHSNEVGTVYYSDTFGHEDQLQILEVVDTDITGEIVYPVVRIKNNDAASSEEIESFLNYLASEEAKEIFNKYCFIVNDDLD